MPDAPPPFFLSTECAWAILEAAGPAAPLSSAMAETTRRWLEGGLERAIHRVRAKPLTQRDVNKLGRAYVRFRYVLQELQDRTFPPPLIPTKDCQTDWDYWLTTHRTLKGKRGQRDNVDWQFIGELVALYEVTSGRTASGSKPDGPTMRFLRVALGEIQNSVPEDVRSYFRAPEAGVLRANLDLLHKGYFRYLREELRKVVENRG